MIYKVLIGNSEVHDFNTWEEREDFIIEKKWEGKIITGTCEEITN